MFIHYTYWYITYIVIFRLFARLSESPLFDLIANSHFLSRGIFVVYDNLKVIWNYFIIKTKSYIVQAKSWWFLFVLYQNKVTTWWWRYNNHLVLASKRGPFVVTIRNRRNYTLELKISKENHDRRIFAPVWDIKGPSRRSNNKYTDYFLVSDTWWTKGVVTVSTPCFVLFFVLDFFLG